MEVVEVTARFDREGRATPLKIRWGSRELVVEGVGRRWQSSEGEHMLVSVAPGAVYELLYRSADRRWYLRQTRPSRPVV